MNRLSSHWIFAPFTQVLSHEAVDLWIVHRGGLFLDLSLGFLLFFDHSRHLGFLFGGSFHFMNSRIFSIGMFPYTMLATMPIFSACDWPKRLYRSYCKDSPQLKPVAIDADRNPHCFYTSQNNISKRKKLSTILVIGYLSVQAFLPYSHFLTKGYNNWTNGLYGYSWDMMVHSWSTQHVTISYLNKDTSELGYLNPEAWTRSNTRWIAHCDMVKQYAMCVQQRLATYNITNIELYVDAWRSLNDRFQQRLYNPNTDIISADWHPLRETPWVMPLLTELSDWRRKLDEIERDIYTLNNDTDIVFIADFPGLSLENYIQEDLGNTTIQVLNGTITVELPEVGTTDVLNVDDKIQLPASEYHIIRTVSAVPSCLMYQFRNTTEATLNRDVTEAQRLLEQGHITELDLDDRVKKAMEEIKKTKTKMAAKSDQLFYQDSFELVRRKHQDIHKSLSMLWIALKSLSTGVDFKTVFNATLQPEVMSI